MKRIFQIIVISIGFLFLTVSVFSQDNRGIGVVKIKTSEGEEISLYNHSYALVVGNGNYSKGWNPLPGALGDVEEIGAALEKNGFEVILKKDLTRDEFTQVFNQFVWKYGQEENNRLLFYYAGHGYTQKLSLGEEMGYLVMVDAPVPEREPYGWDTKCVDMPWLLNKAKAIKSKHVLYIFDSCFSGSILNLRDRPIPEAISDKVKYPVRQFITAGRENEPVPDRSVFKQCFLNLLEGREKEPLQDGYITGEELGAVPSNQSSRI